MSTVDHQSDEGDPELSILANAFLWDRKHKTSSKQATLNLIYATINASMAALPIACLKCGIFVYICLLLFITLVSAYSSIMIVHMADEQSKVLKLKSAQSLDPRDSSFEEATSPMQDVQDLSWQAPPSYMEQTSESNSGFGEISNATVNVPLIRSLQELAGCEEAFGQSGFIGVSIMQLVFSFSLMCISLGFFADTAYNTDLALSPTDRGAFLDSLNPGLTSALDGRGIAVTLAALVLLPLCLLKKSLRSFQWLSNAAVFLIAAATIAAVVSVAARSPSSEIGASDITAWLFPRMQKMMLGDEMREILSSVLVIIFCYAYSQKVFIVYLCLRRRTPKKWTRTVVRANLSVLGLYLIFGVIGSIALQLQDFQITSFNFFNEQQIDVANNRHHLVFCVARVVFAFCLLLSIPMECLTARTTLLRLLRKLSAESSSSCLCSWFRCCSSQSTETEAKEPSSLAPLLGDVSGEGHNPAGRLRGTSSITSTFTDSETRSESLSASISQPPPSHYADPAPAGGVPGNYVSRHHSEHPFVQVIVPAQMQETRSAGAHQNPTAHSCLSRSTLFCYFDSDQWVVLAIWCVLFTISLLCKDWLYIAVGAGAFCTSALVFVLPSMIYFQLFKRGLPSDHGRMALCSKLSDSLGLNLVPNRVYMAVLLVIGFTLLLSSATVALVSLVENRRVVTRVS